jgi:hypothetical protein
MAVTTTRIMRRMKATSSQHGIRELAQPAL